MQLMQKIFFSNSQRLIVIVSVLFTIFFNVTFFSKLIGYASQEQNYFIVVSIPIIFCLLSIVILNLVVLFAYQKSMKIILILLMMVGASSGYFMDTFGTVIDKNMFVNVIKTDAAEALDLITLKLILYICFLGVLPSVLLWRSQFQSTTYLAELVSKIAMIGVGLIIVVVSYMSFSKNYSSFFRNHNDLKFYLNPFFPLISLGKFSLKQLKGTPKLQPIAQDAHLINQSNQKRKLVVFVMGETARAANFSLNGYNKQTNAILGSKSNVVNLSNVYSCGTATAISVPCMFSKFSKDEFGDDKVYYENLVDVLSKVGVNVFWRDNNSGGSQGLADRLKIKQFYGGDDVFDEVMLEGLQEQINQTPKGDIFIVLHQEGSHGPTYFKRYPKAFEKFTPVCNRQDLEKCTQEEIRNTYDNTIAYTDYFLSQTIALLEQNQKEYDTMMLYFSDHGESLGENGMYLHGLPYMLAPDTQKHIPAIVWFGEGFSKQKELLDVKKGQNFSHDNVFHTILGLLGVQTKEYQPSLDLFR